MSSNITTWLQIPKSISTDPFFRPKLQLYSHTYFFNSFLSTPTCMSIQIQHVGEKDFHLMFFN